MGNRRKNGNKTSLSGTVKRSSVQTFKRSPLCALRSAMGRFALLCVILLLAACVSPSPTQKQGQPLQVRVGYFPNITHSQAVIGIADGTFANALGSNVALDPKRFNAGPSVIEALFAGQIDLAYIGPNPAINGYVKSDGKALRIVAGATSGGAVLVVRQDSGITKEADFAGRKIASPQLGNTQDVALRNWLIKQGITLKERGGDTEVLPIDNANILNLFLKKELDAAWVPEPWGARLVHEGGGTIFLDERRLWPTKQFVTAHIIVRTEFLQQHPDIVKRWLAAHIELTQRINADPAKARTLINAEIEQLTGKPLPQVVLDEAWGRITVTYDPIRASLFGTAQSAFALGFLGDTEPNLSGIYDLTLLNEVLKEKGLPTIE